MDFSTLSKEAIAEGMIYSYDLQTLYELDVYLERYKSRKFREFERTDDEAERLLIKSEISWAENTMDICKKRQHDVKEDNNAYNWRFRIHAQKIMPARMYDQVAAAAKRM